MRIARSTVTGVEVVLEIAESFGNFFYRPDRDISEGCAAQVGVQDHARGIDDSAQRRLRSLTQGRDDAVSPLPLAAVELACAARSIDRASHSVEHHRPRMLVQK